nr:S-layer family protein [Nostoc sp. ChiQUE02]MDZ8233050.1 S-layer family protein [Nostoc sp. ChiQUE02]
MPDNTLGSESSQVIDNFQGLPIEVITGGATRQINLFHSFQEFNISAGRSAYFFSPSADIQNILARVTGNNPSEILGKLGTFQIINGSIAGSNANLFLINPNGIVFGKNASLNMQGSFVGTTANGVQFGNQGVFSATNPQAAPLLTINPSVLLFNQIQASGGIINQSQAPAGTNLIGQDVTGLRVADGKSLLLVGGNINIDGGSIRAYGGNVELAGLAARGNVRLNFAGDNLGLVIPENVKRADVSLSNGAEVNVRGAGGGNIKIQARNVNLTGGSILRAGIDTGLGTPNSKGGDININATGDTTLIDQGFIANIVQKSAFGNAGDINITTGTLTLQNAGQINANLYGQGNAGNVNINAQGAVTVTGQKDDLISGIGSAVLTEATGNGGNINIKSSSFILSNNAYVTTGILGQGNGGNIQITTGTLKATNGGDIDSSIFGKGNAGNISINALDNIVFDTKSDVSSNVSQEGVGNGGNIYLKTGSLSLTNGSEVSTNLSGQGNTGNITVEASDNVKLDGVFIDAGKFDLNNLDYDSLSGLQSDLNIGGVGKAGNIQVTTGSLSVTNGAEISSFTGGVGNAGNITINARDNVTFSGFGGRMKSGSTVSNFGINNAIGNGGDIRITASNFLLKDGGRLNASNGGQGTGGNIFLDVGNTITFDGIGGSGLSSGASTEGYNGNAGNIQIETGSLFFTNGGRISSSHSEGKGNGGNITINARDRVTFDGVVKGGTFGLDKIGISGLFSYLLSGEGKGGDIEITTGSLSVTNGAVIAGDTDGQGNGGNITINARDTVSVTNGATISGNTLGQGNGGNITINVGDTVTFDSGENGLLTSVGTNALNNSTGKAGNIRINARELFVKNNGTLGAFSDGQGNGGNIFIDTRDAVTFDGTNAKNSFTGAYTFANGSGNGGNIEVKTGTLTLKNGGVIRTSANRNAGNINIDTRDAVIIDGVSGNNTSGAFSFLDDGGVGKGGDIQITTNFLKLSNGGQLAATTFGKGNAGDIIVNAGDAIGIDGVGSNGSLSGVFTTFQGEDEGRGGNINLTTDSLFLTNGGIVNAGTYSRGDGGNITIDARDRILIDGVSTTSFSSGVFSTVNPTAVGNGGNIYLTTDSLYLSNAGRLSTSSVGQGKAGDININSGSTTLDNQGFITATTNSGDGGNINLTASDRLLLRNSSRISTTAGTAQSGGDGGNIDINSRFIIAIPKENSDIAADAFTGTGGNVKINSQGVFGIESRPKATEKSDITASSELGVSGVININAPDTSSILNSFTELPPVIDTNALIANSCISRGTKRQENSFTITGSGALTTNRPGVLVSNYTTGEVRGVETTSRPWKKGDPIIEPQGLYRLNNGQLLLSRECSN